MGVASLVLGIIALVFIWIPPVSMVTAIIAVVLGGVAMNRKNRYGMGVAGLVCGIVVIAISLIFWASCGLILSSI